MILLPQIPKQAPSGAPEPHRLCCLPWEIQVIAAAVGEREKLQEKGSKKGVFPQCFLGQRELFPDVF